MINLEDYTNKTYKIIGGEEKEFKIRKETVYKQGYKSKCLVVYAILL